MLLLWLLAGCAKQPEDADGDGFGADVDCDDAAAAVHPDADEHCDGIDEDCDEIADDAPVDGLSGFTDADRDGYGAGAAFPACPGDGIAASDGDCRDDDAAVFPGAPEICDGIDDDCDGLTDDDDDVAAESTFYADSDGDGSGDAAAPAVRCAAAAGWVAESGDCDDRLADVHPGAPETCDGIDDDCDDLVDDADPDLDAGSIPSSYADLDGDGFGAGDPVVVACDPGAGWSLDATDCDDGDPAIYPGSIEWCDPADVDEDCDGAADDLDPSHAADDVFYLDADADGWGSSKSTTLACDRPAGYATTWTDCDDAAAGVNPGATEICDDIDDDCDKKIDDGDASTDPASMTAYYLDADGDGSGDAGRSKSACDAPSGFVADDDDCDDADAEIGPTATEVCDEADNDCDGDIDDADSDMAGTVTWPDEDDDGYGATTGSVSGCEPGHVEATGDCDDGDADAHPGAAEACDEIDNDCDGTVDDGGAGTCCEGTGLIDSLADACIDDGGGTSGGDGLEVYCYDNTARFCLSGESCQWRAGEPATDDGTTCESSGLSTDWMASDRSCGGWEGHTDFYCDRTTETIYF